MRVLGRARKNIKFLRSYILPSSSKNNTYVFYALLKRAVSELLTRVEVRNGEFMHQFSSRMSFMIALV